MGTSSLCLRPGYPSAMGETRRPQAQDGHGEFDRAPPAKRSEVTQLIVGRTATPLRLLVLLLSLLSPVPCCGFYAGLTTTAGWLTLPSQKQQQQHRFTGCCLGRSDAELSRGGAVHPLDAGAAAGSGGESRPQPHPPSRTCTWCAVSARGL